MESQINKVVASVFAVDAAGIASRSKSRMYSDPRKVAYFLHWKFNHSTLHEIKHRFNRKSHTGILQMLQKFWDRRETDPEFARLCDECIEKIKTKKTVLS